MSFEIVVEEHGEMIYVNNHQSIGTVVEKHDGWLTKSPTHVSGAACPSKFDRNLLMNA